MTGNTDIVEALAPVVRRSAPAVVELHEVSCGSTGMFSQKIYTMFSQRIYASVGVFPQRLDLKQEQ